MRLVHGVYRPCNNNYNTIHSAASILSPSSLINRISSSNKNNNNNNNNCRPTRLAAVTKCSWNSGHPGGTADRCAVLGENWMEYQGIKNWDGLLDPLDDHLRREILRYGGFVEAAYRSFDFDTSSPGYGMCRHDKGELLTQCGLGGIGYDVARDLHATCGVRLPGWVDRMPTWVTTRSSWIGYVAVCNDPDEIKRLGRRDVVIAYRGTATCLEWLENLRATLTCLPDDMARENDGPMVESGFLNMYTASTPTGPSLRDMVREEIQKIIKTYGDEPLSVTITGHSLGAALATLTAYDITATLDQSPLVTVVSFGGPRVGNKSFRCQLEKSGTKVLRIVNSDDLITKVPGFVIDHNDVTEEGMAKLAGLPSWLRERVEDTRWVYADVGEELRLCSRESPYLRKGDIATCHDLKTYLHLVDGFVSSTCPFRATARKMLGRTQADQEQLAF